MPAMNTANANVPMWTMLVPLIIPACGPTIEAIATTSGESNGGTLSEDGTFDPSATSALGSSTGGSEASDTASGSSVGSSSSGSDEGMVSSSTGTLGGVESTSTTGASCVPTLTQVPGTPIYRCDCDGLVVDPMECGCEFVPGGCACEGLPYDVLTCAWPCEMTSDTQCTCGNFPAPPGMCSE